jgi:hypothetical protein
MNKKYYAQERHRQNNYRKLLEYLKDKACLDCGEDNLMVLDFDHLPEYEKSFSIGRAITGSTRSWDSIFLEIRKCEIVCANCHRIRTSTRSNDRKFQIFSGTYLPKEYEEANESRFRVEHGGGSKGRRGCKCDLCREQHNKYHRELRKK